jgi:hypothetical protein
MWKVKRFHKQGIIFFSYSFWTADQKKLDSSNFFYSDNFSERCAELENPKSY